MIKTVRLSLARTAPMVSLFALLGASAGAPPAAAQTAETEARRCVSLRRVDRTSVVSDQAILFYMNGGDVLRNELPSRCPTLMSQDTFMYRTMLDQLCSVDTITVLTDVGFGFMPGPTCLLGEFKPISEEEREALENRADER